ncbi:MAG: glycosyltransferase, partial [Scytonema sp. PMC 1069.18]|nr:glycosyltransferase [Scytonema sp. PMC 1069.18]
GNLGFTQGKLTYNIFCEFGWKSGNFASFVHTKFIHDYYHDLLKKYKYERWILFNFERVSVNFITWFGREFAKFNGIVEGLDEEQWLSVDKPKSMNQYNCICGSAIVSHFSYYTQREYLESNTNILQEYKTISEEIKFYKDERNSELLLCANANSEIKDLKTSHFNSLSMSSVQAITVTETRPFWSVMIPTYNCANYLVETLESVLAQDLGSECMQIEVVDDYSTKDDPEAVVREIGKGRVSFYRQPKNSGIARNFNTCIERAKGEWIHILHGDDMVIPGFYKRMRETVEQQPTIGAVFCRQIFVDENSQWQTLSHLERQTPGILPNFIELLAICQRIETPSIVVRRSVYEHLGGFHLELSHAADWEMWRRIVAHYPIWYEPQPLVYYRKHSASHTSQLIKTGSNIADIRKSIAIAESYLPKALSAQLSNQSRKHYALSAVNTARRMLALNDIDAAIAQIWEGFNCSDSEEVINSVVTLIQSIDAKEFLNSLSKYAEKKQGNPTSQSALTKLYQSLEEEPVSTTKTVSPIILVDGVVFQVLKTGGIARVWTCLLEEWVKNGFAKHIIILDRAGTAPSISDIEYIHVPPCNYNRIDQDRQLLQELCDELSADLFVSSYYTTPISTPFVFLAHDMIPEIIGWNLANAVWRNKHHSILQAITHIAVSETTADDLVKIFPHIARESVIVANNGVDPQTFVPASLDKISLFKRDYGITKPYFLLVGVDDDRKNRAIFFKAFALLKAREGFDIVCTGSQSQLKDEFRTYTLGSSVHILDLNDEELAYAYSGAVALIFPSKYEGFGLPILEAMACGCPVITCPNGSIPEVAGEAALYVNDNDVEGLADALYEVQKPSVRQALITKGWERIKQFSWSKMAKTVADTLISATLLSLNLKETNLIIFPDWSQPEDSLGWELQAVMQAIVTRLDSHKITLLINISKINKEDAELFISSVTMNLLMEEDLDISEGLAISFVGELGAIQWETLLSLITARIPLEFEDIDAIASVKAENLPIYAINQVINIGS